MPASPRGSLPRILAIACGFLSVGLLFWVKNLPRGTEGNARAPSESLESSEPGATREPGATGKAAGLSPSPAPSPHASPSPSGGAATGEKPHAAATAATAATATPALPSEEELTGPLPTKMPGEKAPSLSALLAPTLLRDVPAPPDFATLARQTKLWPPQVALRVAVDFPLFRDGTEVGHIRVPASTLVLLRKVQPDGQLVVEHLNALATLPAASTDLATRLRPSPPAAVATAAASPSPSPVSPTPFPSPSPAPAPSPARPASESSPLRLPPRSASPFSSPLLLPPLSPRSP